MMEGVVRERGKEGEGSTRRGDEEDTLSLRGRPPLKLDHSLATGTQTPTKH
jgi:hypothetical protein